MATGLKVAHTVVFGDPEGLPIMSLRAGQVVPVEFAFDGSVMVATMPPETLAVQVSIRSLAEVSGVALLIAHETLPGDTFEAVSAGLERMVPAGGQLIEFHHVEGGDVLLMTFSENASIRIHAYLGS